MTYLAASKRYDFMKYNRLGRSGLKLPAISLGLWHNFGEVDAFENCRSMALGAFDLGITYFDLANNYGPPQGAAEETFGRILKQGLAAYRDELIISTKAGGQAWPGPYGDWGSRKTLLASLDKSLGRMGLDYVDIFYSHRPDPDTPLEETMGALSTAVKLGKALYAGISSYTPEQTREAAKLLKEMGTPCVVHQPSYSMLDRRVEDGLLATLNEEGIGCVVFCPLYQGILTNKYLTGIPLGSRASKAHSFLNAKQITQDVQVKVRKLNEIAAGRGQSLAQMALAWVLRDMRVTSALIGASSLKQIEENVSALKNASFSTETLARIDAILSE